MSPFPVLKWLLPLLVLGATLAAPPALGHAQFRDSSPASDSTLENSPHEIVLNFTQAVTPVTVTLVGPDGNGVGSVDDPVGNGGRVVLPVTATLGAGTYVVSFRVLSGDAHAISGGFRFTMAPPEAAPEGESAAEPLAAPLLAADLPTVPESIEADNSPIELAEKTIRIVFIATLLLAVGLVLFRLTITLTGSLDVWAVSLMRRTAGVGLLLAVGYFIVATLAVTGVEAFRPSHLIIVLQTSIGMSLLLAALGFMFLTMSGGAERIMAGIGASALILSRVVTGHPASQDPMLILVPSMAIHVAAAAFWFASLWVLLRLLRKGPLADAPEILAAFARIALWSVAALFVVGGTMAAIHLKSIDALLHTAYGETLLWKLGGVAGLLLFAAINKLVLTPDLLRRFEPGRMKISIRLEALLMIAVITVSTLLAATAPASRADEPSIASAPTGISVVSDTGNYTLQVEFSSRPYDEKQPLSLELFDSSGAAYKPLEVSISVSIPSRRIEALPLSVMLAEGSHLAIDADFPHAQDTRFEALVLVTEFDRERFVFDRGGRVE